MGKNPPKTNDKELKRQLEVARKIVRENRDVLKKLAKS
jgi:hypothetical protein